MVEEKGKSIGFEGLEAYGRATKLRREIYDLVKSFPKDEKYRLSDQLIRSTRKCPAQMVEGYGRFHYQENIQFCRIARGSLAESIDHLNVALECAYIEKEMHNKFVAEITTISKLLNGYIAYLNSRKTSS
ncbi:MAG: four helix bundle protein [Saprospiraceae bacterium]|nr:four helix bundle protein [Saprospiraceae bacterium]